MARNPSVDPLNLQQIRLLAETRQDEERLENPEREPAHDSHHVLRLSINGIAAGMRTTG